MSALRAFLMFLRSPGDWSVSIHRNLEGLESEWRLRFEENGESVAVLHTGFSRPATEQLEPILSGLSGRFVLTDAAYYALPPGHTTLGRHLGVLQEINLYVAATGWGYSDEPTSERAQDVKPKPSLDECHLFYEEYRSKPDWVLSLDVTNADLAKSARENGVLDEATYLQNEPELPDAVREALGWERYAYYVGLLPDVNSLIRNLRFAPEWLLDRSIASLSLSIRSVNALSALGASKIRDLERAGRDGLLGISNLGAKSRAEVGSELLESFVRGPWISPTPAALQTISLRSEAVGTQRLPTMGHDQESSTKLLNAKAVRPAAEPSESVTALLRGCVEFARPQHREVLKARMGFGGDTKTLEEIGRQFGRTRERVRQIEVKAVARVRAMRSWNDELRRRLTSILDQSSFPVPLHGLEILDPWFCNVERDPVPFRYALKHFCASEFALLEVEKETVVSRISRSAWFDAIAKARGIVAGMVGQGLTEAQVRLAIEGLLPSAAQELSDAFWREATKLAHFAEVSGERELVSYGGSVDLAVEAVLAEASTPLHYTEIAARCSDRLGRDVEARRAHAAAANVALLLGRGTFGLERHIPLRKEELEAIVSAAEDLIMSNGEGRQWHAREIAVALEEEYPDISVAMDPYLVSVALSTSEDLVNLGRMVWVPRSSGLKGVAHRIDVRQAVIALLQAEGQPMSIGEIQARLSKERGLSQNFQIHQGDPLIRVSPGVWGLVPRDVPFSPEDVQRLTNVIEAELHSRQKGIHASEVSGILESSQMSSAAEHDPMLILELARRRGTMSLARGQILYISDWGEPRRLTLVHAVRRALEQGGERGLTTDEVHAEVERIIERKVDRATLPSYCDDFAEMDDSGRWRLANAEVETVAPEDA